jgi:tRNA A-37 threonylcarbamoyl transferase component Bud32
MPDALTPDAFPSADALGSALPQYDIEERISVAQESAIYRARQPALDRSVMIRLIAEPTPQAAARLMERLRARARLVHPRIVAVYDFGRTQSGLLYLVTEHVDGRLLSDLIAERQVAPKLAYSLALQLCDTLALLHGQGSKHGALNTRTLLVDSEGQIKVTGIGMTLMPSGEISWLHEHEGTLADDLYAVGAVLHEMFGREPLPEDGRVSRNLPPAFGAVIRRCVHTDPARRFTSATEIKDALVLALRTQQQSAAAKGAAAAPAVPTPAPVTSRPAAAPAAAPAPAPAYAPAAAAPHPTAPPPPMYGRGRPPPPMVRAQPSFMKKLDDFLWSCLSAGLHFGVFFVTATILLIFYIMKDKIVLNTDDDPKSKREEAAIPGEMLGKLPAAPLLPEAPSAPISRPITLPAPDPYAGINAEYRTAVQAEATASLDKVRLDELTYIRKELDRIQTGQPVPDTDEPDLPASLKRLRDDYRQKRAALAK